MHNLTFGKVFVLFVCSCVRFLFYYVLGRSRRSIVYILIVIVPMSDGCDVSLVRYWHGVCIIFIVAMIGDKPSSALTFMGGRSLSTVRHFICIQYYNNIQFFAIFFLFLLQLCIST